MGRGKREQAQAHAAAGREEEEEVRGQRSERLVSSSGEECNVWLMDGRRVCCRTAQLCYDEDWREREECRRACDVPSLTTREMYTRSCVCDCFVFPLLIA